MNRVVNSYSLNNKLTAQQVAPKRIPVYAPGRIEARERVRARAEKRRRDKVVPQWLTFLAVVIVTFALCATLHVKTQTEMQEELQEQLHLRSEIEQLQNDNSSLANEVKRLRSDPATIERAARDRLGMTRGNEKIFVTSR